MGKQDELGALIARHATTDGIHETAIPRVALMRASHPTEPVHALYQPALCVVAQGRKQVMLGEQVHVYDRNEHLVVSLDLPVTGQVIEATPEKPYLCLRLDLDPATLSALLLELGAGTEGAPRDAGLGLAVSPVTPELLDAVLRLVRLLDAPRDAAILAPLAEREILYRLLLGDHAARLRGIALADGRAQQVSRAVGWIKQHFREAFRIEALAAEARLSPSALHHHFKAVTAMSPLQFQKQLRLQEARRLILARRADAASAGFAVGYESPSQFSREYRRLFGAPPLRDAARLRAMPEVALEA